MGSCEVPPCPSRLTVHCPPFDWRPQALLLPLTKEVGGKPRRLSSVIRPPFLVSEAHPNGYVLPNMYRLEFFLWGHTNLVFLPGLHMGGMGPDSCVLVLQDLMHVVLFETHLAVSPTLVDHPADRLYLHWTCS